MTRPAPDPTAPGGRTLVRLSDLGVRYGAHWALRDFDLDIDRGDIVAVIGPNGGGKSTLLKTILGLVPPSAGSVAFPAGPIRTAYLPQQSDIDRSFPVTVLDTVAMGLWHEIGAWGRLGSARLARSAAALARVGVPEVADRQMADLSGGQFQRVLLARALLTEPDLLILDEPTSGLDPNQLVDVRALIRRIGQDKTVILSTHIMQEVTAICNRVIIINKGSLVADDSIVRLQSKQKGITVVLVEFKETADKGALMRIPGVRRVEDAGQALRIEYAGNADMRELLFRFAVDNKLTLLNLQVEKQSLEEIFKDLTNPT